MKTTRITLAVLLALLSATFIQCNNASLEQTVKLLASDPFKNTIVPSQEFEIDATQDNVVEGRHGTFVICPKGCFRDANGRIVEGNVKVELAEALTAEDMVLSNLTTTSDGKLLETGGMIYFNATKNGEQLAVNKDNPVHISIPAPEMEPGMMAYKGVRDKDGNMNWVDPKPLENYLQTVDLSTLDFLPEGFRIEVEGGMPYKGHKAATDELTDSLYYSLNMSLTMGPENPFSTEYNEPLYNRHSRVVDGKYTDDSYEVDGATLMTYVTDCAGAAADTTGNPCGIDPARIKVIKSEKYQNTLIATREFEARLKTIRKSCDDAVLDIYVNNLDKNLYELDSMAAVYCSRETRHRCYSECAHEFYVFAEQRLTNVKDAGKYSALLKGHYEKQLKKVKAELEKSREKLMKTLHEKNEEVQKVANEYKDLLWKREKYRMEAYNFTWTNTGG